MIYELRTYQLRMGALPTYLDLAENKLLPALAEHGIKPVGFWTTEIGTLNEVVHLWAYKDLNDRQQQWGKWFQDPRRAEYEIAEPSDRESEQQDSQANDVLRVEVTQSARAQIHALSVR
jgi:hypothetical protein